MGEGKKHTESDLDDLILSKLANIKSCRDLPNFCNELNTETGKTKLFVATKKLIFEEGIESIDACFGQIESMIRMGDF